MQRDSRYKPQGLLKRHGSGSLKSSQASHPQRAPPPSLFLGPPSRNDSNISLPLTSNLPPAQNPTNTSLLQSRSIRSTEPTSALNRTRIQPPRPIQTEGDRTDALWAEMQATLAEVESSAFSSTQLFGAAHSAALEELRESQIALAKAWGRGEDDGGEERVGDGLKGNGGDTKNEGIGEEEEEEEEDIREAKRRREANERFFKKVEEGVVDVVGKLEGVACAMAKIERESREIWNGSDSVESASTAS